MPLPEPTEKLENTGKRASRLRMTNESFTRPLPAAVDFVLVRGAPVMRGRQGDFRFGRGGSCPIGRAGAPGGFLRLFYLFVCGHLKHAETLTSEAGFCNGRMLAVFDPLDSAAMVTHPTARWQHRRGPSDPAETVWTTPALPPPCRA